MAIADRARDFWDRISARERRLVVVLVIAAPICIAVYLGLAIHDGLIAREKRNADYRKAIDIVEILHQRGPAVPIDDLVATMPSEPVSLNTYLTNAATKSGFSLKGTQPHNAVTKNKFVTNSVTCSVSDLTIEQLKKFLQEIEAGNKHVVVTTLDIRKNFKNSKDGHLDATLEVSTYSREIEKGTGSGSGSAAGSGTDTLKKGG